MASINFLQPHSSDLYGECTNHELIDEPVFLDDFWPQLDDPFDFSIDADDRKRRRVDAGTVAKSTSSATSTASNLERESVYTPAEFTYGYQDLLMSGQTFPELDTPLIKSEPLAIASYSCDTDHAPEEETQRLECFACGKTFSHLRALDKHTRSLAHKAWRCREPGCGKSYARRDTFLRHRSTHSDNSHACLDCLRDGKKKAFKRKDHLSEHIRSCHPKCNDGTRSVLVLCRCWTRILMSSIRTNVDHARDPNTETSRSDNPSQVPVDPRIPTTPQKQAMRDLLNSLRAVLGDRHPNLMGALDSLVSLSGSDMESVAKTVAHTLLAVRYSPAPE
jgi:hypothetical protein